MAASGVAVALGWLPAGNSRGISFFFFHSKRFCFGFASSILGANVGTHSGLTLVIEKCGNCGVIGVSRK